jgi:tetraacyldisaccharide 4'-kinase
VAWLVKRLQARGLRVAIVSRGYKAAGQDVNDEACELARHVTGVPHLQNASRWQGASLAMAQHAAQVIVLDDGFQHRRLHRDLDIVLLDALRPFGVPPEKLFPRGTLREPLSALRRAHAVVLTRVNQVSADQPRAIRLAAGKFAPHAAWATARHQPVELRGVDGMCQPLDILAGRRVFAFCGIGHAAAFLRTLEGCGCQVIGSREFGDHHRFSAGDMRLIAQDVERSSEAEFVLCTTKDLVKIDSPIIAGRSVYALAVEMRIEHGLPELEQQVDRIVLAAERQLPRVT